MEIILLLLIHFLLVSRFNLELVDNAFKKAYFVDGMLPVFCAGNRESHTRSVLPPAELPFAISVGSHTWKDTWSSFSCGRCTADIATVGEKLMLLSDDQVLSKMICCLSLDKNSE